MRGITIIDVNSLTYVLALVPEELIAGQDGLLVSFTNADSWHRYYGDAAGIMWQKTLMLADPSKMTLAFAKELTVGVEQTFDNALDDCLRHEAARARDNGDTVLFAAYNKVIRWLSDGLCWICESDAVPVPGRWFDGSHQSCGQCGEFRISGSAKAAMGRFKSPEDEIRISGWIRHENREGRVPAITSQGLADILAKPIPSLQERMTYLLVEMVRGQSRLSEPIYLTDARSTL